MQYKTTLLRLWFEDLLNCATFGLSLYVHTCVYPTYSRLLGTLAFDSINRKLSTYAHKYIKTTKYEYINSKLYNLILLQKFTSSGVLIDYKHSSPVLTYLYILMYVHPSTRLKRGPQNPQSALRLCS